MTMLKNHNDDDDNRASHNNGNNRDSGKNRVNGDNRDIVCHTFVFFSAVLHCQWCQVFLSLFVVVSSDIRTYVDLVYKIIL